MITSFLSLPSLALWKDLVQEGNMITLTPVETRLLVERMMEIDTLKPSITFWFIETKEKHRKFIQMLRLDSERFSGK